MYRVELLQRARRQLQELVDSDEGNHAIVRSALDQLAVNAKPRDYWDCEDEEDIRFIYTGVNRKWKITYEIADQGLVVYVHSMDLRPSLALDPR